MRLIVQARQIFSYALALRRSWYAGALPLVEEAYASMVRDFRNRDGAGGWVFSVDDTGAVVDATRDFYAHAFVLLGVASYVEATGQRDALAVADETLEYIDRHLKAARGDGYLDSSTSGDSVRRQNPHMHMFEGLMALWKVSSEPRYLRRAEHLFDLFETRFFRGDTGVLLEYFDATLAPAAGQAGKVVEPGHHFEWVWLLRRFEQESGRAVQGYVDALYGHADRHGYDALGLIVDELLVDGSVKLPSHRVWPMTEAIRANAREASLGRAGAAANAARLVDALFDRFLTQSPPGGWIDRLNAKGEPVIDHMPASTLYHVLGAVEEVVTVAGHG